MGDMKFSKPAIAGDDLNGAHGELQVKKPVMILRHLGGDYTPVGKLVTIARHRCTKREARYIKARYVELYADEALQNVYEWHALVRI